MNTVISLEKSTFLYHSNPFSTFINEAILNLGICYKKILSVHPIGSSVQGIPILSVHVGFGDTYILIQATHHAREAITTILTLDQIKYLLKLYDHNACVQGIPIRCLLKQVTFVFVPLVNPDGANLVLNGESSISEAYKDKPYLKKQFFPSWKANINGVDLNENYPTQYPSTNITLVPGPEGYPGPTYFSEPETLALKYLTEKYPFAGSLSYHSSGQVIYWYFNQLHEIRDLMIANKIAQETGYSLVPKVVPSTGSGLKDWFIETYRAPGLTLEVSPYVGNRKVPSKNYPQIWKKNKNVPILFAHSIICLDL